MKRLVVLVIGAALLGATVGVAYPQQGNKPPKNESQGDKKRPPGPIVKGDKKGDSEDKPKGDKQGGNQGKNTNRP